MSRDFYDSMPSLGSVRARLAERASETQEGELNSLLNDAYEYITHLEKRVKKTFLEEVDIVEKLVKLGDVMQETSPSLADIAFTGAREIRILREHLERKA